MLCDWFDSIRQASSIHHNLYGILCQCTLYVTQNNSVYRMEGDELIRWIEYLELIVIELCKYELKNK